MPRLDKVKFRKQFIHPQTKRMESVYFGEMSPSDAARAKEYIGRLITCRKFDTMPDQTVVGWLDTLSDERHAKLAKSDLVKSRAHTKLGEFIEGYLANLKLGENTMSIYRQSAGNLLLYFGKDCNPQTITRARAEDYKRHLETAGRLDGTGGYGKNSIWKKLQHARMFFREMLEVGLVRANPFCRVTQSQVNETSRKEYVPAEYALRAMEYAPCAEWRLIIALWRFGGLRRCCEVLRLRWSDVIWDKSMLRVHSTKTNRERFVPIFPEIERPLSDCFEQAAVGAEWVIENRCPADIKRKPNRSGSIKAANLTATFNYFCKKAGLPIIPMIANNMRASCEKDLYSGKYPELRGRVDLISQILGHSPQIALQYYQRFSTDDFAPLVASFKQVADAISENKCVKQGEKRGHLAHSTTNGNTKTPCFVAPATLENKGQNDFYTSNDSKPFHRDSNSANRYDIFEFLFC